VAERFDVVIVGARCAGAPLAALLGRQGIDVAVVEQATFPSDTLSSHLFEADALAFLDRLGLTERLRETGAPFAARTEFRTEHVQSSVAWPQHPGDVGGVASIRRHVLDTILAEAASESGAEVRTGTKVTGLCEEAGRVVGVRVGDGDAESELRARLVVGADGRNSTVASLCGARRYNVTPNERAAYWGYFEGADIGAEPTLVFHRWADRVVLGCPTDGGLYMVAVMPELAELAGFRGDLEASFMDHALSCGPVARVVHDARRVGKILGAVRWEGFFREASGPGWVLAGDAGHFKDPAAGRGIGDSFRQAEVLAPAITSGLDAPGDGLDQAMARWGRWRDREFAEHYWAACDLGKAGTPAAVMVEVIRRLEERGETGRFLDVLSHRAKPSKAVTPLMLLGATARLLARRGADRRGIFREVRELFSENARRRWLSRRPVYADSADQPSRSRVARGRPATTRS
jgi:flavin-dependent dehydrogenase